MVKHASRALSNASRPTSSNADIAKPRAAPRLSQHALDNFWARIGAMFGHTWASQYGESPTGLAGDTWAAALAGLTPQQVADGLRATLLLGEQFPPSAPHFRSLCFGIPAFAAMRFEMTHGEEPRTPFGLLCWQFVDTFRLRQADQREADRIARDAYELAKAHVLTGGELPEVHPELAKPEPIAREVASHETAKRHLDEMMSKLGDEA